MVAFFCLATAALAAVCHLLFETTVGPDGRQWLAVLALGLGPVGGAFYVWDHGTKHGDNQLLGRFSYFSRTSPRCRPPRCSSRPGGPTRAGPSPSPAC
ncbi:hypothetical protein [Streptomyces sp. NPDC003006]